MSKGSFFKIKVFAPLYRFNSEEEKILLEENLQIRKRTDDEIKSFLWTRKDFSFESMAQQLQRRYILEGTHLIDPSDPDRYNKIGDLYRKIVLALRLFKEGSIGINEVHFEAAEFEGAPEGALITTSYFTLPRGYIGKGYLLKSEEVNGFISFWKEFEEMYPPTKKFLETAINRFNSAMEKASFEDRLIDFIIALEALFLKEPLELEYRLSIRIASFLGKTKDEKNKVFQLIRRAYKTRSAFVHGGIKLKKKDEFSGDELSSLEEIVRRSIMIIIKNGKEKEYLLREINSNLFV